MKLTAADKDLLLEWGYKEQDFWQIEEAMKKKYTRYILHPFNDGDIKVLSRREAIKILGREMYLSGICSSTFYWHSLRLAYKKGNVFFDSSALFA